MSSELIFILACMVLIIYLTSYVIIKDEKRKSDIEYLKNILSRLCIVINNLLDNYERNQELQNNFLYALYYKDDLIFISLDKNKVIEYKESIQIDYPYLVFKMVIILMETPYIESDLEVEMRKENEKIEGGC